MKTVLTLEKARRMFGESVFAKLLPKHTDVGDVTIEYENINGKQRVKCVTAEYGEMAPNFTYKISRGDA